MNWRCTIARKDYVAASFTSADCSHLVQYWNRLKKIVVPINNIIGTLNHLMLADLLWTQQFLYVLDIRILDEREEPGFLTGLKIPAPWAAGKTVETVHPVRDNYKFKETVHIPGARCLYLRFDSRCSSQYDYDKVLTPLALSINVCHLWSSAKLWLGMLYTKYIIWFSVGYLCWSQHQQS